MIKVINTYLVSDPDGELEPEVTDHLYRFETEDIHIVTSMSKLKFAFYVKVIGVTIEDVQRVSNNVEEYLHSIKASYCEVE